MISLILKIPSNVQVLTLPEQAAPQAKQTLDDINASYSFEMMPNSRIQTGQKLLDVLCEDSAEFYEFPPSWQVIYMAKLVAIEVSDIDGEGNVITRIEKVWGIITPLHSSFINYLNDDVEGNRPSTVFEPHRFMGFPERF